MAGQLSDDGTMDTVIRCSECGREQRYNYDSSARDMQDNADRIEEFANRYPADNIMRLQERVDEQCYNEWVDQCIADFDESHECEGDDDEG